MIPCEKHQTLLKIQVRFEENRKDWFLKSQPTAISERHVRNIGAKTFLAPLIDVRIRGSVDFRGSLTHIGALCSFSLRPRFIYFVSLGFVT